MIYRRVRMNTGKLGFFNSIQYSRGLAALIVVIAHTLEHQLLDKLDAHYTTGRLGVEIFFVVSGFIISNVCGSGVFDPGKFFFRRFMRVVPLYWACTILVGFVCSIAPQVLKTTQFSVEHILLSLFFWPHLNPLDLTDHTPLLKLGWTLNYEVFFYICFGLLFYIKSAFFRAIVISLIFVLLYLSKYLISVEHEFFYIYANAALIPFLVGIWLSIVEQNGFLNKMPKFSSFIVLICAAAGTFFLYQQSFKSIFHMPNYLLLTGVALLLVLGLMLLEIEGLLPEIKFLEKMGDSSYSLYLVHMFVVGAAWYLGKKLLFADGYVYRYLVPVLSVVFSVLAGYVSYLFFEKPLIRWTHRVTK